MPASPWTGCLVYNLHLSPPYYSTDMIYSALFRIAGISGDKTMRVWPGNSYPLGATWDGAGVNFALFSEHATKVELCLFESAEASNETFRITLPEQTDLVWHGYLPDVRPGQVYGYRVRSEERRVGKECRS